MRLHRLDLTAFGPYPRHEAIDFDALGQDGLFLLHGDTGAGKTTVLDAVAFALFGAVPGARGEVKRLRCDYASPDAVTEVALEFSVQGHRLRLVRSPEYERPKRNGNGVTTQRARASLTWLDHGLGGHAPDGLTRIDEVARTIQRLLGMTAEQFFQVVLLPQGEFARFLRSDTVEREQLLERLFGTERFADVERWFRDARQASWHVLHAHRQRIRELVARVAQAAGQEPPTDDGEVEHTPGPSWLAAVRARLTDDAELAAKNDQQARETKESADAELLRVRELAERVRRVRTASTTLAELAGKAGQHRVWSEELAAARRAGPVVAAHHTAKQAAAEAVAARQAEERATRYVDAMGTVVIDVAALLGVPSAEPDAFEQQARALRDEAGGLQPLLADAEALRIDEARLVTLSGHQRRLSDTVGQLAQCQAAMPERLVAARIALVEANRAASRLDGLRARTAEVKSLHGDALRLPEAERVARVARGAASAAVDRHQRVREALLDVRQRRLNGMAAELAGDLRDGQPCAVCGSAEHPAPAEPVGSVGEAQERGAADIEQAAARERERTAAAIAEADLRLTALEERVAGRTAAELAAALLTAAAERDAASAAADLLPSRAEAVAALEGDIELLRTRSAAAELERAQLIADRKSLADQIAGRAKRLTSARGSFPDVLTRRTHLLDLAAALDNCAGTRSTRRRADARRAQWDASLADAARKAGFSSPAEAIDAVRDDRAMTKLADQLTEVQNRVAAAQAVLAEPELVGLRADVEIDLAAAEAQATAAAGEAEAAALMLGAAERRLREVDDLAQRLQQAWRELAPVEAEYESLAGLADVINGRGQNARKMSLRAYVLAARLAEVAVAATRRLQQMSQGRYSFVHSDAAGPRGTRGGLGLDVLDDYSGQVRPAKTLSGGESFLASLSLALGLADVVAAETGGALLDTLFIDEGFGMLDADALDQVMDTLDELRAGGRVVGLVSHVDELRQRIPVRLRVKKARGGSTLELIAG
ncbi:MAG TPA: SMC family ATPase [Pseudonocardiaceae bacterium]|nr:SMC family ATPase [Pseudonocardiaceae bacterium]